MTQATETGPEAVTGREQPAPPPGVETTERYETDEGVVFFDAENPLAWLEASRTFHLSDVV